MCSSHTEIVWKDHKRDNSQFVDRLADAYLGQALQSDMTYLVELDGSDSSTLFRRERHTQYFDISIHLLSLKRHLIHVNATFYHFIHPTHYSEILYGI